MAVKIEILDYVYGLNKVGQNIVPNPTLSSSSGWYTGNSWAIANGVATHTAGTGNAGYLEAANITLFEGQRYRIEYKISGNTNGGSFILANHLAGAANGFNQTNNGVFEYDWVQGGSSLNKIRLYGADNFNGSVHYVYVFSLSGVDRKKSVIGELELTDHAEFPLALTFQIADAQEISATTGDYSKTFKVPATKHNNNLLKHIYNPLVKTENNLTNFKPCRIITDGIQEITGLLRISGVAGYGENPSYYECVFYGNNMSWAKKLEGKFLNEPDLFENSKDLVYKREEIINTWNDDDCTSSGSPIVYPVTSYGDYNPDGEARSVQLLKTWSQAGGYPADRAGYYGYTSSGFPYGTPRPSSDWRPAIFVKTTLESIFKKAGYTISSNFMNTQMFKKLVWLLPNFQYNNAEERYSDLGIEANVKNLQNITIPAEHSFTAFSEDAAWRRVVSNLSQRDTNTNWSGYDPADDAYIGGRREEVDMGMTKNLVPTLDNNSSFNMAGNYVEIKEYGQYVIELSGLQARIARAFRQDATSAQLYEVACVVNIEVKTAGENSWNIIGQAKLDGIAPTQTGTGGSSQYCSTDVAVYSDYANVQKAEIPIWLNKGDKIRLTKGVKITDVSPSTSHDFKIYVFWQGTSSAKFKVSIDPLNVYYGQSYNLENVIDPQQKQIDFIKGIAHAFNLVMSTDSDSNQITIEPFNDFYQVPATAEDWTYKLDRSKEIKDNFLRSNLKKEIIFKYKTDDSDAKVKYRGEKFFDGVLDESPYKEELSDDFEKGQSVFENPFFAGTYDAQDRDSLGLDVYSSCLWEDKGDGTQTSSNDYARPDKGYNFTPRLLYWNRLQLDQSSSFYNYAALIQSWTTSTAGLTFNSTELINANINYTNALSNVYPQAVSKNRNDKTYPVLSYGNVWVREYTPTTNTYSTPEIGKGLYETYYRPLVEMLKRNIRIRTLYVDLKPIDIVNLNFRKLIYIDGCYWRLNKIIDYKPNKNTPTKVELVEWIETGVHSLQSPTFLTSLSTSNWGVPYEDIAVDYDPDDYMHG